MKSIHVSDHSVGPFLPTVNILQPELIVITLNAVGGFSLPMIPIQW